MTLSPAGARALVDALLGAVLEAGAVEMDFYRAGVAVEAKADASPVTEADRQAEAILLAALAVAAPGIPVVAEEAWAAGKSGAIGERFFLVDPLDGTREFINKRDEFTVNVALIEAGRPVFGIVYAPAIDQLYATLGPEAAAEARIAPRRGAIDPAGVAWTPIRSRVPDPKALVAVASRSHSTPETEAMLARYPIAARRNAGSSLKFCLIARGEADFYPRLAPTREWDTAAGHAVLAAAGGIVTDVAGSALTYGKAAAGFLNPSFLAWGRGPVPAIA